MPEVQQNRNEESDVSEISGTHSSKTVERNPRELAPPDFAVEKSGISSVNIVVIEKRTLVRECLTRGMKAASRYNVLSFPSVETWLDGGPDSFPASLIVLCIAGKPNDLEMRREVSQLTQSANRIPIIILSDVEDPDEIIGALDRGARGYIPTSLPLEIAVEAMRLVEAGGVFVPANSLLAARRTLGSSTSTKIEGGRFTARQAAVLEAIRKGNSNKQIAYELSMREGAVKVHVRSIMKKLKARNRTEVAVLASAMLAHE